MVAFTILMATQVTVVTAVEVARIGAIESPPEEVFGSVADVALGPSARVYVLDRQADAGRVFARDGGFLFQFGRPGSGPGELSQPSWLHVAQDRITVFQGSGRASSFRLDDGGHLRTRQLIPGARGGAWLAGDQYLVVSSGSASLRRIDATEHLLLLDGDRADTLASSSSSDILVRNSQGSAALRSVFCPLLSYVTRGDSTVFVADGSDGAVRRMVRRGPSFVETVRRQVSDPGRPVSRSDMERLLDRVPEALRATREEVVVPPVISSICGLEVGVGGWVWVRLASDQGPEEWLGLEAPTLEPTLRFRAPEGVSVRAFGDGLAAGVWLDALDVPYVVLYELRGIPRKAEGLAEERRVVRSHGDST